MSHITHHDSAIMADIMRNADGSTASSPLPQEVLSQQQVLPPWLDMHGSFGTPWHLPTPQPTHNLRCMAVHTPVVSTYILMGPPLALEVHVGCWPGAEPSL
jgi:hypothetical protein